MTLSIEQGTNAQTGPVLIVVSDDRNAENVALQECFEGMGYPALAELMEEAETNDEGVLRIEVASDDWADLQEALAFVDVPDGQECSEQVRQARLAHTSDQATDG